MDLPATGMTLSGDLAVPHLLHAQVVPTVEHIYVVPLGRRESRKPDILGVFLLSLSYNNPRMFHARLCYSCFAISNPNYYRFIAHCNPVVSTVLEEWSPMKIPMVYSA